MGTQNAIKHFQSQQTLPLPNSMWQQTTTPALGVVTARAAFTRCQTVHIWHLLCFSEAELDHDHGSAAVQLSPFFYFLMWLVLYGKKKRNLQVKTRRRVGVRVHPSALITPTVSFILLSWFSFCFILLVSSIIWFLQHFLFPQLMVLSTFIFLLHLLLTLRHVGVPIFSFCLQKPN